MRSLVLLAALVLGGCDPSFTIRGDVVDAAGRPIAGAHAVFVCDGAEQDTVETNATGHFTIWRIGVFGPGCAAEIRVQGHPALSFPVMANCTNVWRRWFRDDLCAEVTVHATIR